jgi:hypothetical protein
VTHGEAPYRHACRPCIALQRVAIRRRDPALLDAAIRLREEHTRADAERAAFARARARVGATQQAPRSSMRIALPGGNR